MRKAIVVATIWLSTTLVAMVALSSVPPETVATSTSPKAPLRRAPSTALQIPVADPVARLDAALEAGDVVVDFDDEHGYLRALLEALDVPVSSQGLVFSRTSLQTDRISPWAPRAIYFNDDVYVAWVQGSPVLEIAAIDPDEAVVFYTVAQDGGRRPVFQRQTTTCLMCHESRAVTGGVAGVIMTSVLTDRMGYVITPVHEGSTSDRTPMAQRFGGWYVTGSHGATGHAGNVRSPLLSHEVADARSYLAGFDLNAGGNPSSLEERFDSTPYLSAHSDLVALSVLTHQARVHNMIILTRQAAAEALAGQRAQLRSSGDEAPESGLLASTRSRIDTAVERLLREMLFVREAPLSGPLRGTSGYGEEFAARGPRDGSGRSLRDLDLERRLFRYPLSFLIYADAFEALPKIVKEGLYERLLEVLGGDDRSAEFAHLTDADRQAILEILADTKPGFADAADALERRPRRFEDRDK